MLEIRTQFGDQIIKKIDPEAIPKNSIQNVMDFFNQPERNPITEEEAIWLIKEVRKDMKVSQDKNEIETKKMQTGQASENEVMDLEQTAS